MTRRQKIPTPDSVKKKYPLIAWIFVGLASIWTLIQVIESATIQSIIKSLYSDFRLVISPVEFNYSPGFVNLKYDLKNEGTDPILISKHLILTTFGETLYKNQYPLEDNYFIDEHSSKSINEKIPTIYWHPYNPNDSVYKLLKSEHKPLSTLSISIVLSIAINSKKHSDTIFYGRLFFFDADSGKVSLDASSNIVFYD